MSPKAKQKKEMMEEIDLNDDDDIISDSASDSASSDSESESAIIEPSDLPYSEGVVPERSTGMNDADLLNNFFQRQAKRVARSPCWFLWIFLLLGIGLSAIAMTVGDFEVSAETGGWQSRGTLISDRQNQLMISIFNQERLFYGGDEAWEDLINNVQPGWEEGGDDDDDSDERRRLTSWSSETGESFVDLLQPRPDLKLSSSSNVQQRRLPFQLTDRLRRRLQDEFDGDGSLEGCDMDWYTPDNLTQDARLWPVWTTNTEEEETPSSNSALDPEILHDICVSEQNTLAHLEEKGLCFGCADGKCLPPYSIVLYARLAVPDGMTLTCGELKDAWVPYQESTESVWKTCVSDIKETYDPNDEELPESCPERFLPSLVDDSFDQTRVLEYTSSIFPTEWQDIDELCDEVENFDVGSDLVRGAYETQYESFAGITLDESLGSDMALALGSAAVVAIAIIIHTRSPLITSIGLAQIVLSFPLSYFVYKLLAGLDFFPFLNFIGIFVVFALGAGDIFVAIDKWKNARLDHPAASTEFVAAVALPDAAAAMFLTTLTTAIAFFATAICPVAPIKMFAIFCGLLIVFDYIMNVLLVFPALCIYDRAIMTKGIKNVNCCISCHCCGLFSRKSQDDDDEEEVIEEREDDNNDVVKSSNNDEEEFQLNLIRRILLWFYQGLHYIRWPLFVVCIVVFILCAYYASTLDMPTSSDVRLLEEDNQFEQNYRWRQNLLSEVLEKAGGSRAYIIWGVEPADTGDQNNPASWTQLVLDDTFDASSTEAQVFLNDFCDDLFDQEFATSVDANYTCPIQRFGNWLEEQSNLQNVTERDEIYQEHCAQATGIPVPTESFDSCIIAYANEVGDTSILSRDDKVQILFIPFNSRVRYDDHFDILDDEWHMIEDWMKIQVNENAPSGVNKGYFSSDDFWWYDTNGQMLQTAYGAAAIAMGCAAAVILFSSQSLLLTIFSTVTIGYVLTSVTAMLVAMGWTLGFLEAICFAILIGVSVDFVIHFSHAYTLLKGNVDRGRRTKYALIKMGPSILATAVTTILSAVVMLFTVITFFQKFALILFLTVIQASIGSFVLFLTFVDCIGPTNPTYLVDRYILRKDMTIMEDSDRTERSSASQFSISNPDSFVSRMTRKVTKWTEEGKMKTPLIIGIVIFIAFDITLIVVAITKSN